MAATPPFNTIVDATIPGLQQGKDAVISLRLTLPDGVTDPERIKLELTDNIFMQVFQYYRRKEGDPFTLVAKFEVSGSDVTIIPNDHRFLLAISRTDTLPLKANQGEDKIRLFGTVYILRANGSSRPSSKIDLSLPYEPAFL